MAKKPTTAVANYDEELAALAGKSAALTDSGGGGRFFSTQAGLLQFDGQALPGNQMCVIVGSWCLENVYYEGSYDPDNRAPPTCFAFSKQDDDKDEMAPHPEVEKHEEFERQSALCGDCPQNEWGSSGRGKGKACQNRRRLALLTGGVYKPAGRGSYDLELIDDPDHFASTEEAYLKIPVMSGKNFDNYVREIADAFNKPLFAVYTRIWLEPDPKSQFKVHFELIEPVDNALIPVLLERYRKLDANIDFPYIPFTGEDGDGDRAQPKAANKKLTNRGGAKKPAAKGRR